MSRVISIVQCVSLKQKMPQLARDLYISPLFVNAAAYAEKISDKWYIISAKYGLVESSTLLEPYNVTLKDMSASERRYWAEQCFLISSPC